MLPACRACEEESRLAPLCCDFFDENNFVQRRKRKIGMQAGLASRNLVPHCAYVLPRASIAMLGDGCCLAVRSCRFAKKIRQRNFQNSSGEEVFPEPTSSYKLGVPKLYDAGGAHLGARCFLFFGIINSTTSRIIK